MNVHFISSLLVLSGKPSGMSHDAKLFHSGFEDKAGRNSFFFPTQVRQRRRLTSTIPDNGGEMNTNSMTLRANDYTTNKMNYRQMGLWWFAELDDLLL